VCLGLYPNLVRVRRPMQRYMRMVGGAVTLDAQAKEVQFYVMNAAMPERER
jgi:hypothetical protein